MAHKGFPVRQSVIDAMIEITEDGERQPNYRQLNMQSFNRKQGEISKYLKRLKVSFQIPNQPSTRRTYICNGLAEEDAKAARFTLENGSQSTVFDYFKNTKHYEIKRHDLPCLWVGPTNKKILLPVEVNS